MHSFASYTKNRNYGCRVKEYTFNGIRTVSLENDLIKVVVLADKGTDIVEFVYKPMDVDFLWHSFNKARNPSCFMDSYENSGGSFLDLYEGGWQELFPNIGASCEYKGAHLGIHGEVCNQKWDYIIVRDEVDIISVKFFVDTVRTPYHLEKVLTIKLHDLCLYIEESVTNEGNIPLQFMWGHHPAFGPIFLDDSCYIEIEGNASIITNDKSGNLKKNSQFSWPIAQDQNGNSVDVSKIKHPDSKFKIMCAVSEMDNGEYRIINSNIKLGFGMKWEKELFPYIWIWEPNCSDEQAPWYGRNYVIGIEPWSALPQDLSIVAGENRGVCIHPQETISTSIMAYAFKAE